MTEQPGSRGRRVATDPQRKAEVLRLADEVGSAEASRRTGVAPGTIRAWRHRAGEAGPPKGVDPATWAEQKEEGAREAWAASSEALIKVRALIGADKMTDAKNAALTMAILIDKSGVMEEAARRQDQRRAQIVQDQAQLVLEVMEAYFSSIGLEFGPGHVARKILAHFLRQAERGAPLTPPPAEQVRAARAAIVDEVRADLGREQTSPAAAVSERRALPAPRRPHPDGPEREREEAEPMAPPVRRARPAGDDVEVVTGEVVDAAATAAAEWNRTAGPARVGY